MGSVFNSLYGQKEEPSETDIQKQMDACDALVQNLGHEVTINEQLKADLGETQKAYDDLKKAKALLKNGKFDGDSWKSKSGDEKTIAFREVQTFGDRLSNLNKRDVHDGRIVFAVTSVLLVASIALYVWLHWQGPHEPGTAPSANRIPPEQVIGMQKNLVRLGALAALKEQGPQSDSQPLKSSFDSLKVFVVSHSRLLSSEVVQLTGTLEGRMELGELRSDMVDSLGRMLTAHVKSLDNRYFWFTDSRRWLEIAFWSLWGTLVGILFYLAVKLSAGIFDRHEIPEMVSEVIITPLVVITIFFMFNFSGLVAISLQESSVYQTLGFAFILGFAIRRTVGLLDMVKRRLLPEPSSVG